MRTVASVGQLCEVFYTDNSELANLSQNVNLGIEQRIFSITVEVLQTAVPGNLLGALIAGDRRALAIGESASFAVGSIGPFLAPTNVLKIHLPGRKKVHGLCKPS